MFWGCIWPNGTDRLVLCEGTVNVVKNTAILQENFYQSTFSMFQEVDKQFIFQQDNAPAHLARKPKSTCMKLHETPTLQSQPKSLDWNIIESSGITLKTS